MKFALALTGLVTIGVASASAQYIPRPVAPVGPMPGNDVGTIVRSMGLDPVGTPVLSGTVYLQRAMDYYGQTLRVVVDAHRGHVLSVQPITAAQPVYGGPYAPPQAAMGGPYRRAYPPYALMPPDYDDDEFMMPPRYVPPPQATKPAAVRTQPPVPRKRPDTAPKEAAMTKAVPGDVTPSSASPQAAPSQPAESAPQPAPLASASPAEPAQAKPDALTFPPVAVP